MRSTFAVSLYGHRIVELFITEKIVVHLVVDDVTSQELLDEGGLIFYLTFTSYPLSYLLRANSAFHDVSRVRVIANYQRASW